jgi:cyanophycinase
MIPKGKLVIIGGHEDKGTDEPSLPVAKRKKSKPHIEILSSLISKIPRETHVIEIIAAASAIPKQMEAIYKKAYKEAGFTQVGFIRIENKRDVKNEAFTKRIDECHAIFFTGGDQTRLTSVLNKTVFLEKIKKKYQEDKHFIIAGTSAGAMALPKTIIAGGIIKEALMKNDIKIGKGFNLISNVMIDTHFIERGRFARLAHAVALNPFLLGIGLGEDTAISLSNGNKATCIGSGMVIIIDGSKISKTNIKSVNSSTPIIIENMKVHILAEGSTFLVKQRKIK